MESAEHLKAAKLKDEAWEQRQQELRVLSAKAFACWLASKDECKKQLLTPPEIVSQERSLFQVCAADGISDADLVVYIQSRRQPVIGRRAGSCYLQRLYQKYQQERAWDPAPMSEIERKKFVFGGSEQAATGGSPSWQKFD